jgi:hypothetical protein
MLEAQVRKGKDDSEKQFAHAAEGSCKYFYLSRPPCIGTEPDGWVEREAWSPARAEGFRQVHGFVVYSKRLDFESTWRYDLLPEDLKEQAEIVFWREPEWIKEDYLAASPELLHEHRYNDNKAWAALILLDLI